MAYIDNYNPMQEINVTGKDVEDCKKQILKQLDNNQYIHLSERFSELRKFSFNYRGEDATQVFLSFSTKVSSFMAFQEALLQLVHEGEIMPVKIPNTYSFEGFELRANYSETSGGCTTTGQRTLNVPVFAHEHFIRCPSRLTK